MTDAEIQLLKDLLPLLIPIFIIQVILWVVALVDLSKRKRVRGDNKIVWVLVIIFLEIIGPILYLLWGRHPDAKAEDKDESGYTN
jgi:uncharacterized membrane protein